MCYRNGLKFVNDITDRNGRFICYDTLCNRFGNGLSFLDYLSLKDAMPPNWRKLLKQNIQIYINPEEETVFITQALVVNR